MKLPRSLAPLAASSFLALAGGALAAPRALDPARSTVTVHVFKSGVFSAFADNHEVRAPLASGSVEEGGSPSVEAIFDARKMTVLDPRLAPDKRAEVQKRMLGPDVLDVGRYPEIRFRSTGVERLDGGRWRVTGSLALHGRTAPVSFEVKEEGGVVRGSATLKQRTFGIEPITVAGGTVKVKDELRVDFEFALAAQ